MSFYSGLKDTANRLLTTYGQDATVYTPGSDTYDPDTGESTFSTTNVTVRAAIFPISEKYVDGSNVLTGDKRVLLSADASPVVGGTITIAGVTYSIVDVKEVAPGGESVINELQVRKGG